MQVVRIPLLMTLLVVLSLFAGCEPVSHAPPAKPVKFEVYLAEDVEAEGLVAVRCSQTGREVFRQATPLLTNSDVEVAMGSHDELGHPAVSIQLDKRAAKRNRLATSRHVGKPVVIVLDGEFQMVSVIHETLSQNIQFTGKFTPTEAEQIALGITIF